jgi:hypothetical protein
MRGGALSNAAAATVQACLPMLSLPRAAHAECIRLEKDIRDAIDARCARGAQLTER